MMGIGQAVRHWVLVPGSGVRIPHPQPSISILLLPQLLYSLFMRHLPIWQYIYNSFFLTAGLLCLWLIHVNEESIHQAWPLWLVIPAAILIWAGAEGLKNERRFNQRHGALRILLVLIILGIIIGCSIPLFLVWGLSQGLNGLQF